MQTCPSVRKTADGEGVVSFGKFLSSSHAANFIIFFFFLISRFCFLLVHSLVLHTRVPFTSWYRQQNKWACRRILFFREKKETKSINQSVWRHLSNYFPLRVKNSDLHEHFEEIFWKLKRGGKEIEEMNFFVQQELKFQVNLLKKMQCFTFHSVPTLLKSILKNSNKI